MERRRRALDSHSARRRARSSLRGSRRRLRWLLVLVSLIAGLQLLVWQVAKARAATDEAQPAPVARASVLGYKGRLPSIHVAEPAVVVLGASGRQSVLLVGLRLGDVIDVGVVTDRGASSSQVRARIVPGSCADPCTTLLVELVAGPSVRPDEYRLQLNTPHGGVFAPRRVSRIVVR